MGRLKWNLIPDQARWDYWCKSTYNTNRYPKEKIPKYLSEALESQIYIINDNYGS